jgi:hypothetical protein
LATIPTDTSPGTCRHFDDHARTRSLEIMHSKYLLAAFNALLGVPLSACAPDVGASFESTQRARQLSQGIDDGKYARLGTRTGASRFWPAEDRDCLVFHHEDEAPQDMKPKAARAAVFRAIDSWSSAAQACGAEVCLHLADAPLAFDGRGYDRAQENANLVTYVQDAATWNDLPGASPTAFALTVSTYRSATGQLLDTDVFVNQAVHVFGDAEADPEVVDLESVVLHEIGHALGFGHPPRTTRSVMRTHFKIGMVRRGLYPTDVKGLCDIYAHAGDHEG